MPKYSKTKREEARELYLTGECSSLAEVSRRLNIKPHTAGVWRKEEDWDGLRIKIERQAAEKLVEELATERVTLNKQHFKMWGVVVSKLLENLQKNEGTEIKELDRVASILDRAQKGQRLARGLSLDGKTEEMIRASAEADSKALVDLFVDVVKDEVQDEQTRDRIARAILERVPVEDDEEMDVQ